MGLVWLATLGTNIALWFPGSGGVRANVTNWYEKNYRTFIQPSVDRLKGIRPPLIKLKRESDDLNGNPVFSIADVQIIDFEKLKSRLEEQEAVDVSKARKITTSPEDENIASQTDEPDSPFAELALSPTKYQVTLTVKKDAFLGEIDFTDWKKHTEDFDVVIKDEEGRILENDSDEYKNVLATLDRVPLTLNGSSFLPDHSVKDKTAVKTQFTGIDVIDGTVDVIKTFFDDKLRNANIDPVSGQNAHLSEDKFTEHLALLATKIEDDKKEEIIDGYYQIIEQGIINDLAIIEKEKKIRDTEIAARTQQQKRSYTKALLIGLGVAALIAVGIALIIVLWPAGIAAGILAVTTLVTSISLQVLGFFLRTPLLATIGIFGTSLGLVKNNVEYQKARLNIAEEELKNLVEGKEALTSMLAEIAEKKTAAKDVIQAMVKLRDKKDPEDTVTINLKDKKVEELGSRIINKYFQQFLQNDSWQPKWNKLHLSLQNCGITTKALVGVMNTKTNEVVAEGLVGLLKNNQTNRLKIQALDITANPIDSTGIEHLSEALKKNFTLTTLKYDIVQKAPDDTLTSKVSNDVQNEIAKNLILNRYLQNPEATYKELTAGIAQTPKESALPLETLLQNAFKSYDTTTEENIFAAIKSEATKKVRSNYEITRAQFPTLRKDLEYMLSQNETFSMIEQVKDNPKDVLDTLALAYNLASENGDEKAYDRCGIFIQNTQKLPDGINKLQQYLRQDHNITTVQNIKDPKARTKLLTILAGTRQDADKKAELLANMLEIKSNTQTNIVFQKAFEHLFQNDNIDNFKKSLELFRQEHLAKWDPITTEDIATKKAILELFDDTLHPDLQKDSLAYKQHKLNKLVAHFPDTVNGKKLTLEEFINIYQTIAPEDLVTTLENLNTDNLVTLLKADVYNKQDNTICELLKKLDEKHCYELLAKCFTSKTKNNYPNEEFPAEKAALLAKAIAITDDFVFANANNKNALEYYLYYAFIPADYVITSGNTYNYQELEKILIEQQLTARKEGDLTKAQALDTILQAGWQKDLEEEYACLRPPFGQTDFAKLKTELLAEDLIRRFEFPANIDDEVKNYIEHITTRNQLYDALPKTYDRDPQKHYTQFLTEYFAISPNEKRQACLNSLIKMDDAITEQLLTELIASSNEDNAANDATLVTELITELVKNGNFVKYISDLKQLTEQNPHIVTKIDIDSLIKDGLQTDLTNKLQDLLKSPPPPEYLIKFAKFKEDLEDNAYILQYDFNLLTTNKIPQEIKNHVNFILLRNNMYDFTDNKMDLAVDSNNLATPEVLQQFMQYYTQMAEMEQQQKIQPKDLDNALNNLFPELDLDKALFYRIVARDIGSHKRTYTLGTEITDLDCTYLRKLNNTNPRALQALLQHCFAIDSPNAAKEKAELVTKLLNMDALFTPEQLKDPFVKDIATALYWSMVPGDMRKTDRPFYDFTELKNNLNAAITKHSSTAPQEILENVKEAVATIDIPQIKPEEEHSVENKPHDLKNNF